MNIIYIYTRWIYYIYIFMYIKKNKRCCLYIYVTGASLRAPAPREITPSAMTTTRWRAKIVIASQKERF